MGGVGRVGGIFGGAKRGSGERRGSEGESRPRHQGGRGSFLLPPAVLVKI